MLLEHDGKRPRIHESAYVAPTAVVCGDVTIGENCRVLFGAVIVSEGGPVTIGSHCPARRSSMPELTRRYSKALAKHKEDRILDEEGP
jgi:carbonic anhydrase/acetyltransferase-like protein (isoleucine patch superfamily)